MTTTTDEASSLHSLPSELQSDSTFLTLGVAEDLIAALDEEGITSPFPVQALTVPDALRGVDVCGQAKTGSGKTLAFGIVMVQGLARAKPKLPTGLILVPTRELATQVADALRPLAEARNFSVSTVYGGVSMGTQIDAFNRGTEIVVATPGRLIDLMERKAVRLDNVTIVTIDEADQMADMGFLPQVRRIMRTITGDHQTLLFSATLDGQVGSLVSSYMKDPVRHEVISSTDTVDTSEHRFIKVHHMDKIRVAAAIARSADRTLIFVRTKHGCDAVEEALRAEGISAAAIHGDRHQRHREKALAGFADGRTPVLVATNVAARGLHVEGVDVVLHYDPPDDPKTYLHRSGRTARAGESGLVVTLVEWDQVNEVIKIQREAGLNEPMVKMFSNDERLTDLTTWEAEEDAPIRTTTARRLGRRRRRRM